MENMKLLVYQFSAVVLFEDSTISNNIVMPQIREQIESHSPIMQLEKDANGEVTADIAQSDSYLASIASTFFPYFRLHNLFSTFLGQYFHDRD